jgi:hypothetical protein
MGTGSNSDSDGSEVPATQLPPPKTMMTLRASAVPSSAAQTNVTSTSSDSEEDKQSQELLTPVPQRGISINHAPASEHIEQPSQQLDDAIEVEESKEVGADAADASDDDSVSKSLSYGADKTKEKNQPLLLKKLLFYLLYQQIVLSTQLGTSSIALLLHPEIQDNQEHCTSFCA